MDASFATVAMSTPTIVLSYAAAFFFVVVAIAAAYALVKAGKTLDRVEIILNDVDKEAVPLMQKAGVTLDGVNANLGNVDQITKDVADITDKIDSMANVVEGAVSTPARKAAAFGAGVQGAVSSFMRRDKGAPAGAADDWSQTGQGADAWTTPATGAADAAGDATATAGDATATASATATDARRQPARPLRSPAKPVPLPPPLPTQRPPPRRRATSGADRWGSRPGSSSAAPSRGPRSRTTRAAAARAPARATSTSCGASPATCCAGRTRPGRGPRWPSTRARPRPATVTPSSPASSSLRERHLAPEAGRE